MSIIPIAKRRLHISQDRRRGARRQQSVISVDIEKEEADRRVQARRPGIGGARYRVEGNTQDFLSESDSVWRLRLCSR